MKEDKTFKKRRHETTFRDEIKVEAEPRRNTKSRISKSFGLDFIAYFLENEPQTYKETTKAQM